MATGIDKRRLVFALIGGACLVAPLPFFMSLLPSDETPAQTLFAHMPVSNVAISNIQVGAFSQRQLPVHVTDSSARLPIGEADLGRIPVKYTARDSDPAADTIQVHAAHVHF